MISVKHLSFSCVIPIKGKRPYFEQALASLYNQRCDNLEVIVEDGDVVPDSGQSDALNRGFAKAKGEWLFWLNADDVLLPGALGKVSQLLQSSTHNSSNIQWVAGNQLLIDDKGKVLKCSVGNAWHDWLYRNAVPHVYGPSSFFRRELFEKVGGFDTSLKYCMDWDLWIKFMKTGAGFVRVNDYLWAQRQWAGSKTQRALTKEEMAEHLAEIDDMCLKNGFRITKGGAWLTRAVRLAEGCYFREFLDGCKWKGRQV